MPFCLNNRHTFPPDLPIGVSKDGFTVTIGEYTLAIDDFRQFVEYVLDQPLNLAGSLEKYGVDIRLEMVKHIKCLRLLTMDGKTKLSFLGEDIDPYK